VVILGVSVDSGSQGSSLDRNLLHFVVQRIFAAGLLLNSRTDGAQLTERVEQAVAELDEALRSIQLMALRSQPKAVDLDQLLVRLIEASDDVARLAEARREDGPGSPLDETARHLHRARMALMELQVRSNEDYRHGEM
jgi:hypothetical protein